MRGTLQSVSGRIGCSQKGNLRSRISGPKRGSQSCRARLLASALILGLLAIPASARDDGRYANSPLKSWFDNLKNKKGYPCCSDADGTVVKEPDWESRDGHYRVRIDGKWIDVPDEAVITEPNRYGPTMVWPLRGYMGVSIRCFMPGAMI